MKTHITPWIWRRGNQADSRALESLGPRARRRAARWQAWKWLALAGCLTAAPAPRGWAGSFSGAFYKGEGDVEALRLLDTARRMFAPDPEFQNVAMLYTPQWNGFVEGPTWGAWWVQNSYGTTYCALPFYEEPHLTFLQNSQDLWFSQMGDGQTSYTWRDKETWVPPDGCLMDAASDTWAIHRQGDGRVDIHDWGLEFTAAGGVLQAELLLISRDPAAIHRYLAKLERCADFIESRRDPDNDLFLAGPAANLLAPSYAGYRRPDGTYGRAYLSGLSVTYIAFLDRLIELEKLTGRTEMARQLAVRRAAAREGLQRMFVEDGYLVKSMDPDGTRHGVYGASRFGYFEASPNHDAICFRLVDDLQARRIYERMASIPGLRPHDLIIANCPSLDDMYEEPRGLWAFGTWVNGGHWTTCEARMMMAYHRVGAFADARRSMEQVLRFARQFRLDNPLVDFGGAVYQPRQPINLTYDAFGAPAGLIRGLFEYLYQAEGLTLVPHLPPEIDRLEQRFPIRVGNKRLYLAASGHGRIVSVRINGRRWRRFDESSVFLPYAAIPDVAAIEVVADGGERRRWRPDRTEPVVSVAPEVPEATSWPKFVDGVDLGELTDRMQRARRFAEAMKAAGRGARYEAAHARLALSCFEAARQRADGLTTGRLPALPEGSHAAANRLYLDTAKKLFDGLERALEPAAAEGEAVGDRQRIREIWQASNTASEAVD